MANFYYFVFLMMVMGLIKLSLNFSHFLNSLLSLEFLAVVLYTSMCLSLNILGGVMSFSMYYLVMVVSESVLGLSLLVVACQGYSVDYIKSMNLVMC